MQVAIDLYVSLMAFDEGWKPSDWTPTLWGAVLVPSLLAPFLTVALFATIGIDLTSAGLAVLVGHAYRLLWLEQSASSKETEETIAKLNQQAYERHANMPLWKKCFVITAVLASGVYGYNACLSLDVWGSEKYYGRDDLYRREL